MSIFRTAVIRVNVSAPPVSPPPNQPISVSATIAGLVVSITFISGSNNETGFEVRRTLDGGSNWTTIATLGPLAGPGSIGGSGDTLTNDKLAVYEVRAVNAIGPSAWVASQAVRSKPNAPTSLALNGTPQPGLIPLTAIDNNLNETSHILEHSSNGTTGWTQVGSALPAHSGTGSFSFQDATVLPNTSNHYYRLSAAVTGGGGTSTPSNVAGPFTTPPATGTAPVAQFVKFKRPLYGVDVYTQASKDPDGAPLANYTLDWGDGTIESFTTPPFVWSHNYSGPAVPGTRIGPFTITLTVTKAADGQTHQRISQVFPKYDRTVDFIETFTGGVLSAAQNGWFWRASPSLTFPVQGKADTEPGAPGAWCLEKLYPAREHGDDNQTATEQRFGCNEEINEVYIKEWTYVEDGTEPWGKGYPYYHRTQLSKNLPQSTITAGTNVITCAAAGALVCNMDDDGPTFAVGAGAVVYGNPGKAITLGNAFRLAGTFSSDGAGNLTGVGTLWTQQLAVGNWIWGAVTGSSIGANDRWYKVVSIADDTHMVVEGTYQPWGNRTNQSPGKPPIGSNLIADKVVFIVNISNSGTTSTITMSSNAFNSVLTPTTARTKSYSGSNNKNLLFWDKDKNYSGGVDFGMEHESSTNLVLGENRLLHKLHAGGNQTDNGKSANDYGSIVACPYVTAANRGKWFIVYRAVKFSLSMNHNLQCKTWVEQATPLDPLIDPPSCQRGINATPIRPLNSDPATGLNAFTAGYHGGNTVSGYSKDMSMYTGRIEFSSIAPDWFPGWEL